LTRNPLGSALLLAAAAAGCLASSAHPTPTNTPPLKQAKPPEAVAKPQAARPAAAAGIRASIDPATGQLREPTAEEAKALSRGAAARSRKDLEAVVHPNGMTSVDLKDAFLMDILLRRNADGSLWLECAPDPKVPAPTLEEK